MSDNFARFLIDLANGCWVSRCLHTVVEMRLADSIGDDSPTFEELSRQSGADPYFLAAIIYVLSRKGVFCVEGDRVSQTPASQFLRLKHTDGVTPIIDWMGSEEVWNSLGQMPRAMRNNMSGFELAHSQKLFEYLVERPSRFAIFNRQMDSFTRRDIAAVLEKIDFSSFATIADVGCGSGVLSMEIAKRYPSCLVFAFDLASEGLRGLRDCPGIQVVEGDFFEVPLPSAELTILSNILHDWSDSAASEILASVRRSAAPGAHLFIIEGLVDSSEEKVDLVGLGMAVMTGGRQRSRAQYEALLQVVGFEVSDVVKCTEYVSVMKAQLRL